MNTYSFWTSRTFWSTVALFVVTGTNGIQGLIPAGSEIYIQGFLSFLITYFHLQGVQTGIKIGRAQN